MKALVLIFFAQALIQVILSATAPCVSRSTIIQRGQNWVDKKVPYSQTKFYDGYRTDCSGFISMCWGLSKPGLSTTGLGSQATRITKDNLLKGDALIYPSVHVVLFVEWADAKKNSYVSMQQAGTSKGTIRRIVPYPFFDNKNSYYPIRYKNACST